MSDSDLDCPMDVEAAAEAALAGLLPEKSKELYEAEYKKFETRSMKNKIPSLDEKYADMINVYAFNFTDEVENRTNNLAPMYSDFTSPTSVNSSIVDWMSTRVRKDKINIVVATYARTYTLARENRTIVASPIRGPGVAGTNTVKAGYLAQYEFCALKTDYTSVANDTTQTVYFTKNLSWISSETAGTLVQKYTYVLDNALGGVAIYTLDWDDWKDACGMGPFAAAALAQEYFYSGTNDA